MTDIVRRRKIPRGICWSVSSSSACALMTSLVFCGNVSAVLRYQDHDLPVYDIDHRPARSLERDSGVYRCRSRSLTLGESLICIYGPGPGGNNSRACTPVGESECHIGVLSSPRTRPD